MGWQTAAQIALGGLLAMAPGPQHLDPDSLPSLRHAALAHRCDDGHTVAEVLAYATRATHGEFRVGTPALEDLPWGRYARLELPVLVQGRRVQDPIEGKLRYAVDDSGRQLVLAEPLAWIVQLGQRPFACYANQLVMQQGGRETPALDDPRPYLPLVSCAGGQSIAGVLAKADCHVVEAGLRYAYHPDTYALELVIQVVFDKLGRKSIYPKTLEGWSHPQMDTTAAIALWVRRSPTGPFTPSLGLAEEISRGGISSLSRLLAGLD